MTTTQQPPQPTLYPESRLHERGVAHGVAYTILMDSPNEGRVMVDDRCLSTFQRIPPDQWADAGPYRPSRSAVAHAAIRAALDELDEYPPSLLQVALRKAR